MKFLWAAINIYGVFILSGLTAILWYICIYKSGSRSVLKLSAFPFAHFPRAFNTYKDPAVLPIMLGYVTFFGCVVQLLLPSSPNVYVFVWGTIMAYEIFGVTSYVFRIAKIQFFLICITIIIIFIGYGILETIQIEHYRLMTRFDFTVCIYLFIVSVYVLARIIVKDSFKEDLVAFFIFSGLVLYSFLHLLAAGVLALGVVEHFNYAYYATLIAMLFWIVVIPWIRHLTHKLSRSLLT